ncbi:hypothetical protein F1D05_01280 [Kribbella qitaiheensis]|uniref:Arsenate reductase n=1 Tax=Kribbella qitaiheensis TaxID=1544730 RepID=A0A7G6WS13_9ACTN|nr:hypothetical protein [Kribbella qitaiheensis]QNE16778.1 hypothetical protein F1D05_01280 [Kribbella qitaiheensis]
MSTENWVPDACTLPTAEQPLRVAEFDDLFATSLRAVVRTDSALELRLDAAAEETARALTARETDCCSFFTFTFSPSHNGEILLTATVPPTRSTVLDALATRATAALS